MRKIIKSLLEGLFDDFGELFAVEDDMESLEKITTYKINSLMECNSIEDMNTYIMEKMNLIDIIEQVSNIINQAGITRKAEEDLKSLKDEGKINVDYYGNSYYWYDGEPELRVKVYLFNDKGITLYFREKTDEIPGLVYRNKPVTATCIYMTDENKDKSINLGYQIINRVAKTTSRYGLAQTRYSKSQGKYVPLETGDHPKLQQMKKEYNAKLWENMNDNIFDFLQNQFNNILHTDKIFAELEAPGKVYKVVQKDYDRMENLFSDSSWKQTKYNQILTGFDKITNPNKLIARIFAYFIAAKNYKAQDQIFQIDENLLLTYFFGHAIWSSRRSNDLRTQLILKMKKYPELHLKDIVVTYEAYKDKF